MRGSSALTALYRITTTTKTTTNNYICTKREYTTYNYMYPDIEFKRSGLYNLQCICIVVEHPCFVACTQYSVYTTL